jgi:hypothetical protein
MRGEIAIGELSRQTKCNIETIRYYERIGLLPLAHRPGGRGMMPTMLRGYASSGGHGN